ncbi:MAG: response regulator transcription factor [Bacteroidales bacterium]|nr:response regulator transcription factor [Bacteroidales bacterium]
MPDNQRNIKIILVEDDVNLGFLLAEFLESNGFEVKLYRDGTSALQGFSLSSFDFCIIDVMLPGLDGFTLTEKLKKINRDIPVIILSARSLKEDKLTGFRLGIDDYITKPFDEEELLYRIRAVLNRLKNGKGSTSNNLKPIMIGCYKFEPMNQVLSFKDKAQRITVKESRILQMLAAKKNNVVTRDEIMLTVWGESDYYTGRSLDVFISKLRGYLKNDPSLQIVTVPTVGYRLEEK